MSIVWENQSFYSVFSEDQQITVGQQNEDICIPGLKKTMSVQWDNDAAVIKISQGHQTQKIRLQLNQIAVLDHDSRLAVHFTEADPAPVTVALPQACTVNFGRSSQKSGEGERNQLVLKLPFVSGHHFRLVRKDGTATVTDLGSKNGLYLNGRRIQEAELNEGDVLSIFTLRIRYSAEQLELENIGNALVQRPILPADQRSIAPLKPGKGISYMHSRAPRLVANVSAEVINLEQPPEAGATPQMNWMSVLIMPIISVVLMLVLVIAMGMSPIMLIMSGDMTNFQSAAQIPWKGYTTQIKTVVIENGVTDIGGHAFYACENLTHISIPDSITDIWGLAFCGCTSLQEIALPPFRICVQRLHGSQQHCNAPVADLGSGLYLP